MTDARARAWWTSCAMARSLTSCACGILPGPRFCRRRSRIQDASATEHSSTRCMATAGRARLHRASCPWSGCRRRGDTWSPSPRYTDPLFRQAGMELDEGYRDFPPMAARIVTRTIAKGSRTRNEAAVRRELPQHCWSHWWHQLQVASYQWACADPWDLPGRGVVVGVASDGRSRWRSKRRGYGPPHSVPPRRSANRVTSARAADRVKPRSCIRTCVVKRTLRTAASGSRPDSNAAK